MLNLKFIQLPFRKIAISLLILLRNKEGGSRGQLPSKVRTRGSPGASGCAAPPAGLGEHRILQGVLLTVNTLFDFFPQRHFGDRVEKEILLTMGCVGFTQVAGHSFVLLCIKERGKCLPNRGMNGFVVPIRHLNT